MKQIAGHLRWNSLWNLALIFVWTGCHCGQVQAQEANETSHTFHASMLFGKSLVHTGPELESAMGQGLTDRRMALLVRLQSTTHSPVKEVR